MSPSSTFSGTFLATCSEVSRTCNTKAVSEPCTGWDPFASWWLKSRTTTFRTALGLCKHHGSGARVVNGNVLVLFVQEIPPAKFQLMFLWWSIYTSRKVTSKEPQTPRESCLLSPLHFPIQLPWTPRLLRLWALRWRSVMPCFSELLMVFWRKILWLKSFLFQRFLVFEGFWEDLSPKKITPSSVITFLVTPSHGEETMMIFPVHMLGHVGCHVPRSKRWFSTRLTLDAWGRVSCASVDGMARVAWMVEGGRIWDGRLWH